MSIHRFIERRLALLACLISILALTWPVGFSWMKPRIPLFLGIIMFGMGAALESDDFKRVLQQPKYLAVGALAQFVIMPFLGFVVAKLLRLGPELTAGIILLGACPGGTASNVIAFLARANVELSVTLTMASTLLAPLLTPWLTWVYAHAVVEVRVWSLMADVLRITLIPVIGGLAVRAFFPRRIQSIVPYLPAFSGFVILAVIGCVVSLNAETIRHTSLQVALAVFLHNGGGLLVGYGAAAFFTKDVAVRRTISIEVGMQNSGLAAALSLGAAGFGPLAALPAALFSVWHNITGTLMAGYWRRKNTER